MISAGRIVKQAREAAGLSQAQLAERMGTTQSAIARLESPSSNPRIDTLDRAVAAAGRGLKLSIGAAPRVDETMIASNLRTSPAERLRHFTTAYRDLRRLAPTVRERRGP